MCLPRLDDDFEDGVGNELGLLQGDEVGTVGVGDVAGFMLRGELCLGLTPSGPRLGPGSEVELAVRGYDNGGHIRQFAASDSFL